MGKRTYGALGMKWFNYFTKVRPWINFTFCLLNTLSVFGYDVSLFDSDFYGTLVIFNAIYILGYLASSILQLILFFKADKWSDESLLKYISAILIFDIIFYEYQYCLNQYYTGMTTIEIVTIAAILLIFEYFIWYRLNMKYFKRRLAAVKDIAIKAYQTQSLSFENGEPAKPVGNYNVYGSDMALLRNPDTEEKEAPKVFQPETPMQWAPQALDTNATSEKVKFCSRCGGKIDNQTKQCTGCGKQYFKGFKPSMILSFVLILLLIMSGIFNAYLYKRVSENDNSDEIAKLQSEVTSLESKNAKLKTESDNLKNKVLSLEGELDVCYQEIHFIDDFVVFIEDDGTDLYHKYQCYKFVGNSFWAFNVEAAISSGYAPCPLCCD